MSQLLRTFGHNDGYGTTMPVQNPIQPKVGVFNEVALQRYDFVLNALAQVRCCSARCGLDAGSRLPRCFQYAHNLVADTKGTLGSQKL